jgi:hypothetical protein
MRRLRLRLAYPTVIEPGTFSLQSTSSPRFHGAFLTSRRRAHPLSLRHGRLNRAICQRVPCYMRLFDARYNCDENERCDASIEDDESAHPFRARKSIFLRPFVCERRSAHVVFTACGKVETC